MERLRSLSGLRIRKRRSNEKESHMWLAPSWFGSGVFWVRQFSNTDSLSYGRLSWVSPWGVVLWQSKYLDLSSSVSYPSNILLGPFTHFEQSSFQDGFQQTLSQGWSWPRGKQTEPWSLCVVKLYVAQVHSTGYPSALLSWPPGPTPL